MRWKRVLAESLVAAAVAGAVCASALAAGGARAPATTRAQAPLWVGIVRASYTASGRENNGNCPSCVSSTTIDASVTVDMTASKMTATGFLTQDVRVDYNSQCGGKATRDE